MKTLARIAAAAVVAIGFVASDLPAATANPNPPVPPDFPIVHPPWDECEGWCVYEDWDFTKQMHNARVNDDLDYRDWDKISSILNTSEDHWLCAYNYDHEGGLHLVMFVPPRQGWQAHPNGLTPENDVIDHLQWLPENKVNRFKTCDKYIAPGYWKA